MLMKARKLLLFLMIFLRDIEESVGKAVVRFKSNCCRGRIMRVMLRGWGPSGPHTTGLAAPWSRTEQG